jgi:hypothetical protein
MQLQTVEETGGWRRERRKISIDLPLKISLTEEGVRFFMKHKKRFHSLRMADGTLEYGIPVGHVSPLNLQKMITAGYVSTVELARTEFITARRDVIDLTKLIVHGILYHRFDEEVFRTVLETNFVKNWNRTHPTKVIDGSMKFSNKLLDESPSTKGGKNSELVELILRPVFRDIKTDGSLSGEERVLKLLAADKYLKHVRSFVWHLIQAKGFTEYSAVVIAVRESLKNHLEKQKVSDFIGLILLELASYVETQKMQRQFKLMFRGKKVDELIYDDDTRSSVLKSLETKKDYLYITFKIRDKGAGPGGGCFLKLALLNREFEHRSLKREVENKKKIVLGEKTLLDFYRERPDGGIDISLGLYYLNYLQEACSRLNIRFESAVNNVPYGDFMEITLCLQFK